MLFAAKTSTLLSGSIAPAWYAHRIIAHVACAYRVAYIFAHITMLPLQLSIARLAASELAARSTWLVIIVSWRQCGGKTSGA